MIVEMTRKELYDELAEIGLIELSGYVPMCIQGVPCGGWKLAYSVGLKNIYYRKKD